MSLRLCLMLYGLFKLLGTPTGNTINIDKVKKLNKEGKIVRNIDNPPTKDTVAVPDAGFTLIRFVADNPGFWLIHSTTTWFEHMGMGVILQVRLLQMHKTGTFL